MIRTLREFERPASGQQRLLRVPMNQVPARQAVPVGERILPVDETCVLVPDRIEHRPRSKDVGVGLAEVGLPRTEGRPHTVRLEGVLDVRRARGDGLSLLGEGVRGVELRANEIDRQCPNSTGNSSGVSPSF